MLYSVSREGQAEEGKRCDRVFIEHKRSYQRDKKEILGSVKTLQKRNSFARPGQRA